MSTEHLERARRTVTLSHTADHHVVPDARSRLAVRMPQDRFAGWVGTLAVTLIAGFLRFWHLGRPHAVMFDETYYAKDAWSLWHHGYALNYADDANQRMLAGHTTGLYVDTPNMVTHPEVGKWLIGLGEHVFGLDPFGWRFASAVVGTLMITVLVRLARRLTGSTLLGCVAGLLLCFDGLQLTLSRIALLDIFVSFFVLCAVSCLVADRDWGRARITALVPTGVVSGPSDWGPVRGLRWRPWRLAAGLFFGLAIGTKWNGLYPLAAFGVLVWMWDAGARRAVGVRFARLRSLFVDALPAFGYLVVVAVVVYVLSWTGWLMHAGVYEKAWSRSQYGPYWGSYLQHPAHGFFAETIRSLRSLWHYHHNVYEFHTKFLLTAHHDYQSKPQGWVLINRPVDVFVLNDIPPGQQGCTAAAGSHCLRTVTLLGTPLLWWGGVVALAYSLYGWIGRRDWRFGMVLIGAVASWLPWIPNDDRPIFSYYAIAILPFTVLAVTLCLGVAIGDERASPARRTWGTAFAGAFVVLVFVNFVYLWPVLTDGVLSVSQWADRLWFRRWV